jgi:hypothetical protein
MGRKVDLGLDGAQISFGINRLMNELHSLPESISHPHKIVRQTCREKSIVLPLFV